MTHKGNSFERAAEVLERAFRATNIGEQGALLDEALRLHRLAIAEERARLAQGMHSPELDQANDFAIGPPPRTTREADLG